MLVKFENKSNRVKGLAFHPRRPWLLASLHNGLVQIWDYRMGTLVDKYEEHEGPVRGCSFHPSQPLFVTGGDDGKIRVFNYQQRRCLFTLTGHMDYIRTVFFHNQSPWIVSASDDQTVRVWNWQSRTCLAVLTGHSHYVMCAQFHPSEDLLVSASLDQTIRVWDIGALRRKHSSPSSSPYEPGSPRGGIDLFGTPEGQVKYVLEGHDRGVNWVQFHPTKPLIVSGSDDRSIKLWRYNDNRAWETDTFRGHFNNISCVMFHPHADVIISNSEDKTIRIWDYARRGAQPVVYRRDSDRFWILTAHPSLKLIAAGHDNGLMIFKLGHERPGYTLLDDTLFMLRGNNLISTELLGKEEAIIANITEKIILPPIVSFSTADNTVIVSSSSFDSTYFLNSIRAAGDSSRKGEGSFAIFIARNRFATLSPSSEHADSNRVLIKALDNTTFRTFDCPKNVNRLLPAILGGFFMISPEKVFYYDLQQDAITVEASIQNVKYVTWSYDNSKVAFYGKQTIYIVDRRTLSVFTTIRETVNVKSALWDVRGILFFTNSHHLKYVLPNGDVGIICTIDNPLYLVRVRDNSVIAIDRACTLCTLSIDITEMLFKLALLNGDQDKILKMVENCNLIGQSIIAYLRQNGYAEIALGFVTESATRFELALECCDLEIALESAIALENQEVWCRLAEAAMALGNFLIAEQCFINIGDRNRLSFLYLITGNLAKLQSVTDEARAKGDINTRLRNSLFLSDNVELANALVEVRSPALAYLACRSAGLDIEGQDILEKYCPDSNACSSIASLQPSGRLTQLEPLMHQDGPWPITADPVKTKINLKPTSNPLLDITSKSSALHFEEKPTFNESTIQIPPDFESGGWGIEDSEMPIQQISLPESVHDFVDIEDGSLPQEGPHNLESIRSGFSHVPFYLFALGEFDAGIKLLREEYGVVNFDPLEPLIMRCLQGSGVLYEELQGTVNFIPNLAEKEGHKPCHPKPIFSVELLIQELGVAFSLTTSGKFFEASKLFENTIHSSLFLIQEDEETNLKAKEIIDTCREYLLGLRIEHLRKESLNNDAERSLSLACYFTLCDLRNDHLILALRSALTQAYKLQCLALSGRLSKRLLQYEPPENVASQARKIIALADKLPLNHSDPITVDDMDINVIDARDCVPIRSDDLINCSFCKAAYKNEYFGSVCVVCNIAEVK